jgi:serine/threonine protein phosphatase 1
MPTILRRARRAWQKSAKHRKPRLPDGICIYAVSDIHGCAEQLAKVFATIDHHLSRVRPKRPIQVFLGDYIDRGPASSQVIDMLVDRGQRHETIFLKGNHEAMLLDLLRDPEIFPTFKQYGGLHTLLSYGLTPSVNPGHGAQQALVGELAQKIPHPHRRFFDDLRPKFLCGDFFWTRRSQPLGLAGFPSLLKSAWCAEQILAAMPAGSGRSKMTLHPSPDRQRLRSSAAPQLRSFIADRTSLGQCPQQRAQACHTRRPHR